MNNSGAPRRHGIKILPLKLHVPREVIDLILADLRELTFSIYDLTSLRMVCHSLATALRPDVLESKALTIYLDEQGMREAEALVASSPYLAESITKIAVGSRRLAHHPVVLVKIARVTHPPQTNQAEDESVRQFTRCLLDTLGRPNHRWGDFADMLTHGDDHYKIENDDILFEGCEMFPSRTNFTPSDAVLRRFVQLLPHFKKLMSISSNERVEHVRLAVKNSRNNIISVTNVHNRDATMPRFTKELRCDNCKRDRPHPKCLAFTSLSRFFFRDLGRINLQLPHDSGLFRQLKVLDLNLPNHKAAARRTSDHDMLVAFLRRCVGLQKFRLATREHDPGTKDAAFPIRWILGQLHHHQWRPPLEHLELSCVDPADDEVVQMLESRAHKLRTFYVKNLECVLINGFPRLRKTRTQRLRLLNVLQRTGWTHKQKGRLGPELHLSKYKWSLRPILGEFPSAVIDGTASLQLLNTAVQMVQGET